MSRESEIATTGDPAPSSASPGCAWCGAPLRAGPQDGFATIACEACVARTTWPVPSDADLELAYGSWYRPAQGRFSGIGDRALRFSRGRLARRLDRIAPPGPILDVGAGDGALLDALGMTGREAIGLERSSTRSDVREEELDELDVGFAGVVVWH